MKKQKNKNKEKLQKLKQLQELQELERILLKKEQQNLQKKSVKVIKSHFKGYIARRKLNSLRKDFGSLKSLRNIFERSIDKRRSKCIRDLIFGIMKASQEKLKNMKEIQNNKERLKYGKSERNNRNGRERAKNFVSLNEARNQQYDRGYKSERARGQMGRGDCYLMGKIVAFVRGWKIRKIMK